MKLNAYDFLLMILLISGTALPSFGVTPQDSFNRVPFRRASSSKIAQLSNQVLPQEGQSRRLNQYSTGSTTTRPNLSNEPSPGLTGSSLPATPAKFQIQEPSATTRSGRVGNKIEIPFGAIQLIDDIQLPALETGSIVQLDVEEGQYIKANTVVAHIDEFLLDLEEKTQAQSYENARNRALDKESILAAQKELALYTEKYRKSERLYKNRSVSDSERKEAKFQMEIANHKLEKARLDQDAAVGEAKVELMRFEIVKARRRRCQLVSKYDAYVIKINKKVQEYVNIGDEVMQLGRMDVLWAQGTVDASDLNAHDATNRPVTVTLQMADDRVETFEGRVDYIPLERQGSEQYAVKVRIKNRRASTDDQSWLLRPLARVKMTIHLDRGFVKDPIVKSAQNGTSSKGLNAFQPAPVSR